MRELENISPGEIPVKFHAYSIIGSIVDSRTKPNSKPDVSIGLIKVKKEDSDLGDGKFLLGGYKLDIARKDEVIDYSESIRVKTANISEKFEREHPPVKLLFLKKEIEDDDVDPLLQSFQIIVISEKKYHEFDLEGNIREVFFNKP